MKKVKVNAPEIIYYRLTKKLRIRMYLILFYFLQYLCRKEDIPSIVQQTKDRFEGMCRQLYLEENGIKDEVTEVSISVDENGSIYYGQ